MSSALVAGLDIGSATTVAVIAEVAADAAQDGGIRVLGVGQARTSGIRRELVADIEATTESIRKAIKEAELMAGVSVDRVYTGIAGEHIHGHSSSGVVAIGGNEISPRDVDRVHEVARAIVVPGDREVFHALPQEYIVDAQSGVRDPVGMAGTRLEAEVYIVTGSSSAAQNIRKSVSRAGYRVEELVLESLASSLAVLSDDDREIGAAVVELGSGTTEVTIFHDRKIRHLASLPWGGNTVTNDIVKGLSLPYAEAARAKDRWGSAQAGRVDPLEVFEFSAAPAGQARQIPRELLAHIIEQRMDEILSLVAEQIDRSGFADRLGGGVVLTGGGASLDGITELAEQIFTLPVRRGIPGDNLGGLVESVRYPKFATATGLVLYGAQRLISEGYTVGAIDGSPVSGVITWMRDWFRDFF